MTNWQSPGDSANVDVLLATYNGAPFLETQLDSLLAQTHRNWRLIVRDDNSTDKTAEIIVSYRARNAGVRSIVHRSWGAGGTRP